MALYNDLQEYEILQANILNAETDEEAEAIYDKLQLTDESIERKLPFYARMIKNIEGEQLMYKTEADRLAKLAKSRENAVKRIKSIIQDAMIVTGRDKVQTDIGTYRIQKNPPSCKVYNEQNIPEEYWIPQDPKLDGKGIIEHYKQTGEQLPGVDVVQEMGLRFR